MFCELHIDQYDWSQYNDDLGKNYHNNFFCQGKIEGIHITDHFSSYYEQYYEENYSYDLISYFELFDILINQTFFSFTFLYLPNKKPSKYSLSANFCDIYRLYNTYNENICLYFCGQYYFQKPFHNEYILVFKDITFFEQKDLHKFEKNLCEENTINRIYTI